MTGVVTAYDKRGQIRNFLINGVEPSLIARTVGCDPSYISQLLEDKEFYAEVEAGRLLHLQKGAELDQQYDKLEDMAAKKLLTALTFMSKPMEIARVMEIANRAKRRTSVDVSQQKALAQVNITIPQVMLQQVVTNPNGEVVRVGDTSLVTMPSSTFKNLALEHQNEPLEIPAELQRSQALVGQDGNGENGDS